MMKYVAFGLCTVLYMIVITYIATLVAEAGLIAATGLIGVLYGVVAMMILARR
jgi:hypothetical protein